jgi:mono/diheme cytochrome c family protein
MRWLLHDRLTFALAASLVLWSPATFGQEAVKGRTFSSGYAFIETSGEELFANACQGCHMPDARGAVGAGSYPPLAENRNLEVARYPVDVVVRGRRAMPPFGDMMSDDQIAAVVNFVRTHFGNDYRDPAMASDVRAARQ